MTTRFAVAACAALGVALLNTGARAQTAAATDPNASASTAMPGTGNLNDTDKLFMVRSAQGDMAEIQTAQMALKKSKTDSVKQVAQTIIDGHSQSLKEGMGLGTLLALPAPKDVGVTNMAVAAQLMNASGKDFDQKYLGSQTEAHENTIALYNMELAQGQNPQVKAFAAKYLPGVEGHTQMIYQAALQVNAPGAALRPTMPPTVAGYAPSMAPAMAPMSATEGGMTPATPMGTMGSTGGTTNGGMPPNMNGPTNGPVMNSPAGSGANGSSTPGTP